MELPRIAALAEISWSNASKPEYPVFVENIEKALLPIYTARGYNFSPYAFEK